MGGSALGWLLAGLANVVGGWFTLTPAISRDRLQQAVALGAGFLLGGALLTMLPEAMHARGGPGYVAMGFLGLYAARRLFSTRRESGPAAESAWAATLGMALHSFMDGGALGATAQADPRAGTVAWLAVLLHKLPEGFGLAALVLSVSGSRKLAFLSTAAVGVATFAGAALAYSWAEAAQLPQGALLGLAAGSFLYVGSTEMLPSLPRRRELAWFVLAGATIVYLLSGGGHTHTH